MSKVQPRPSLLARCRKYFTHMLVVAIFLFTFAGGVLLGRYLLQVHGRMVHPLKVGATFSIHYAEDLGLDWREAYIAMLDDLQVKRVRLPAYWDIVQMSSDDWDFSELDWQIREADQRGVEVVLAVGRKLPRWPECHVPSWVIGKTEEQVKPLILDYIRQVVSRYSTSSAVVAWQVENEPFFPFGICPAPDRNFLTQEVELVHSLDYRPVIITESGELSTWFRAAYSADVLGVSAYRVVWTSLFGYFYWPISPQTYFHKSLIVRPLVDSVFISELQAEPWSVGSITDMPIELQKQQMSPHRLRDNIEFARSTGVGEVYLWGVEWWYYAARRGYPDIWDAGKKIIGQENEGIRAHGE